MLWAGGLDNLDYFLPCIVTLERQLNVVLTTSHFFLLAQLSDVSLGNYESKGSMLSPSFLKMLVQTWQVFTHSPNMIQTMQVQGTKVRPHLDRLWNNVFSSQLDIWWLHKCYTDLRQQQFSIIIFLVLFNRLFKFFEWSNFFIIIYVLIASTIMLLHHIDFSKVQKQINTFNHLITVVTKVDENVCE